MTSSSQVSQNARRWIAVAAVLVVAVAGYVVWGMLVPSEDTDDAQVSGHVSPVATRVTGTVVQIEVQDNQPVKAGDVLVRVDPRDYELAVAHAEAQLKAAEATLRAARHDVPIVSGTARSDQQVADVATQNATAGLRAADREVDASRAKVESARAQLLEAQAHATRASRDRERLAPLAEKD
jgi:membrane fusion protein (multidrug efflux system)